LVSEKAQRSFTFFQVFSTFLKPVSLLSFIITAHHRSHRLAVVLVGDLLPPA
jgi:hypothetical protein